MAGLTRKVFAERLDQAIEAAGLSPQDMKERGWPAGTLSRWRNLKSGPPGEADKRKMEHTVGLPSGSFDASASEWKTLLNALKTGRVSESRAPAYTGDRVANAVHLLGHAQDTIARALALLQEPPGDSDFDAQVRKRPAVDPSESTGKGRRRKQG